MSRQYLGPYINFQGRAREAMELYQKVLGGKLDLQAGPENRISHARLEAEGAVIIASDGHPDYPPTIGDNMAIAVGGTDRKWLTKVFQGLAEGGKIKRPLGPQPWGGEVGFLIDKFGINWTVNVEAN